MNKNQNSNKLSKKITGGFNATSKISKPKFEDILLGTPISKKMRNSLIYKMENADSQNLRHGVSNLASSSPFDNEVIKSGIVPIPRDGHTAVLYKNYMIVFGGDRNKFPFNDLFVFNI
jgi:hypothetical protein